MPTEKVLAGIGRFQEIHRENRELFERLATQGQSPEVLVVGCSDSRAPAELITQIEPGDLFVLRNIANIVPPFGTGEMGVGAVVEFAVLHLQVKHIVVMGHTNCGGIRALDEPPDWHREPHLARWIEHARGAKTKVEASGLPQEQRPLATVRENVVLQLGHLRSYNPVREGERAGMLALHGWLYYLETGNFERYDERLGDWMPLGLTVRADE
jgi:carbonic anhydrase